ncbi:MAG TPA: tetratricopeptide repeat protein [Bacteroidetes bacterium]|nr:tetratricopeptide repeat protein [Bacteroidota bacterium]
MPETKNTPENYLWKKAGFIATVVIFISFPLYLAYFYLTGNNSTSGNANETAYYVGGDQCIDCHPNEYHDWHGSDHDRAMDYATDKSVEGDFNNTIFVDMKGDTSRFFKKEGKFYVHTKGPGGKPGDFRITHTFGVRPLQQYLVPFDSGRLQCLPIAWDTITHSWFSLPDSIYKNENLTPDNWLYWTNNGQNWNGMCADCHSTNLKKGYDPDKHTYHTTWTDIDVNCEACHGPGSEHIKWANLPEMDRPQNINYGLTVNTAEIDAVEEVKQCARCHARRSVMGDFTPDDFHKDLLDYMIPQLLLAPQYFPDGQILDEDYVYGSFTQSYMYQEHLRVHCSDCHNVHSLKTILPIDDNQLCLQCHRADVYDTYQHTFHKKTGEPGNPLVLEHGKKVVQVGEGAKCVNCHMPGRYYMGVDFRRDHSLRIPRPDLSMKYGTPNACNQCHTDKTPAWAESYIREWYGKSRRHHYGEILARGRESDPAAQDSLILIIRDILHPVIVRATAVALLQNYPNQKSFNAIQQAFSDPESIIREAAVRSLPILSQEQFKEALLPMLNDPVKAVRIQAAFRLSSLPRRQINGKYQKAFDKTLKEYQESMLYMGDFASSRHNLGMLYANLGQTANAITNYEEAIRIDNLFFPAKINLALLYNQTGQNDKAEKMLLDVIHHEPDFDQGYYYLGLLMAEKKDYNKALSYLLEAVRRMPDYIRINYNIALLYQQMGKKNEAEKYLLKCLQAEPDNFDYLLAAATFYLHLGDKDKARRYASLLTEKYPQNPAGKNILNILNGK